MALLSAQELLARHGITYVATRSGKFTTDCPNCGGAGYCNVVEDNIGVQWYCHQCEQGNGEKFEQPDPKPDPIVKPKPSSLGDPVKIWDYTDEAGAVLFRVYRFEPKGYPKQYRQRAPDGKWSLKGCRLVPFQLPDVLAAVASDQVVWVVEGEKDCDTLRDHNVVATCNAMGAGKWRKEYSELLRDADVIVCGDNDEPGRRHVDQVARSLHGVARRVRVLDLAQHWPGINVSDDVSDYLKDHSIEDLWRIADGTPDFDPDAPKLNGNGEHHGTGVSLSCDQFLAGFVPPTYLIKGVLQRRFIYSLTGQTGHAKTAVALLLARLVSCADPDARLKGHAVEKGRVIYFVGENPDDVRMRIIGTNALRTDQPERDNIWFIAGVTDIGKLMDALRADCQVNGDAALVIVDTSAAYFLGKDELSNTELGNYARTLRLLTTLPGGPCVVVLCHPIKRVEEPDQLLPRGGGAYLAEVDGNLTLWRKADETVELSYNKMRGPGFQPICFKLETIRTPKLTDSEGHELPTVQAICIGDAEEDQRERQTTDDEDRLLTKVLGWPEGSLADWAKALDWVNDDGAPMKMKVQRILLRLCKPNTAANPGPSLARKVRGNRWQLTEDGKEVARRAHLRFNREAST